jgi:hypothetical protein
VNNQDRHILRELGQHVSEIAAMPQQQETISSWKALNGLQPNRPMVMIDQIPWHEMEVDEELRLRTEDPWCRGVEQLLRRTLYKWDHIPGDMVVEAVLDVPMAIVGAGFGPATREHTAVSDPANDVVGHLYIDQITNEEELYDKVRVQEVWLDEEATQLAHERALEVFDGVLGIRMQGATPVFAAYDRIVTWRSAESVLWDLVDRPDFSHMVIARFTEVALNVLDQLETKGLLGRPQSLVHCTGAWSNELPASGFDPRRPRAKDLWTYGMAQIFSSVSPSMHKEFWLDYAVGWYERFGLGYYGCCEPLEYKVPLIRALPNVRKISMSPFVDVEAGAEAIGGDYVFSRKPSPALLAVEHWDANVVRDDLRKTLDACDRYGCPLELILKDVSTVRYEPKRLWEWNDIARELVGVTALEA